MNNAPEQYVVKRCSDTKYNGGWHTDLTADGLNALRWKDYPSEVESLLSVSVMQVKVKLPYVAKSVTR